MFSMLWEVEMSRFLRTVSLPWAEEAAPLCLGAVVPMQVDQLTQKSALRFQGCDFSSHTVSIWSPDWKECPPDFTGPSGGLLFSYPSLWSSGEIWRTHMLLELSLIMRCLCCTCRTLADVLILLPAYFSSSGLSSRCSSKCFLLRPFTTRRQNRSCAPASALQIFSENIIHVPPFHLNGNSSLSPWA